MLSLRGGVQLSGRPGDDPVGDDRVVMLHSHSGWHAIAIDEVVAVSAVAPYAVPRGQP